MVDPVLPAVVAVVGGAVVAALLLVPFVAVQVRRHGSLTLGRSLLSLAVPVYALALVAYTLLPFPSDPVALCAAGGAGTQLVPGQFVLDAVREQRTSTGLLSNPAVQQFALNVALFVPLGALVRHLLRRGVIATVLVGLGVSALVEVTQGTAVWGLFPCPYRLLDVDDLLANTLGAYVGALVAPSLGLLARTDGRDPAVPRPVTRRRRLLGMVCDVVLATWATLVVAALVTAGRLALGAPAQVTSRWVEVIAGLGVASAFLVVLLRVRRTPGEAVVRLRPRARTTTTRSAVVRWLLGIGGYLVLEAITPDSAWAPLLAVVSVVAVVISRDHRGLAYRVAGWQVEDDRTSRATGATRPAGPVVP